ncbi:hypothetical protein HMPREF3218_0201110 [Prevotella bivia]|nr:hypothetical protein HMPREF3218_0201110 [Prevotella bivia]
MGTQYPCAPIDCITQRCQSPYTSPSKEKTISNSMPKVSTVATTTRQTSAKHSQLKYKVISA